VVRISALTPDGTKLVHRNDDSIIPQYKTTSKCSAVQYECRVYNPPVQRFNARHTTTQNYTYTTQRTNAGNCQLRLLNYTMSRVNERKLYTDIYNEDDKMRNV